jgi:signal peptide peptidase SppA
MSTDSVELLATFEADRLTAVPYLGEWITNWAIYEPAAQQLALAVSTLDVAKHLAAQGDIAERLAARRSEGDSANKPYAVDANGIATIPLSGPLMKQVSSFSAGTSTVMARRAIRQAAADPEVQGIMLRIDSPGGTVAGAYDLADDVYSANLKKPVAAYAEDMCASAAYAVGSQAGRLSANRNALVGSIGTYVAVRDYSQMFAREGVKVHVIRAGSTKGMGTPGTEITADQLTEIQREINALQDQFDQTVARGRKMTIDQVKQLADGKVHVGTFAQQLGLLDGVESVDAAYSQLVQRIKRMSQSSSSAAAAAAAIVPAAASPANIIAEAAAPLRPLSASLAELRQACPGASSDFILSQLDKGASVQQAQGALIELQNARIEQLNSAPPAPKKPGVAPLNQSTSEANQADFGDALAEWDRQVEALLPKHRNNRHDAGLALAKSNPGLYEAYLDAYNAKFKKSK